MVREEDVVGITRLLARVGEPNDGDLLSKRKILADGLRALVEADIYLWSIGVANLERPGDAMPTTFIDDGWVNEAERTNAFRALIDGTSAQALNKLTDLVRAQQPCTLLRRDLLPPRDWKVRGGAFMELGIDDMIFCLLPFPGAGFSCLGLHRRIGKPRFTNREKLLAHMVFHNVPWIHHAGLQPAAGTQAVHLSPRQREVLLMLLRGDSRKEIAAKLKISQHTAIEYVKAIYRRYSVSSRGELLACFISRVRE